MSAIIGWNLALFEAAAPAAASGPWANRSTLERGRPRPLRAASVSQRARVPDREPVSDGVRRVRLDAERPLGPLAHGSAPLRSSRHRHRAPLEDWARVQRGTRRRRAGRAGASARAARTRSTPRPRRSPPRKPTAPIACSPSRPRVDRRRCGERRLAHARTLRPTRHPRQQTSAKPGAATSRRRRTRSGSRRWIRRCFRPFACRVWPCRSCATPVAA
jgi:hypothetical protein